MTGPELSPSDEFATKSGKARVLLLACGALAREIVDLIELNKWLTFDIQCLPAKWHNTPQYIVPALRQHIQASRSQYQSIYVLYGDCGTGGSWRDSAAASEVSIGRVSPRVSNQSRRIVGDRACALRAYWQRPCVGPILVTHFLGDAQSALVRHEPQTPKPVALALHP